MFCSLGVAAIVAIMTPAASFGPFSGQTSTSKVRPQAMVTEEPKFLAMLVLWYLDLAT